MAFAGGSTNETLRAFGAKSNPEMMGGQWWRFVTPIFIHIGWLHLLFNSYALWIVGPQVEKLYGAARFLMLYVLTGVAGVWGSYYYHPQTMSAGASGAIFGLFGVLLVFGIRYRDSIPPSFKRAVGAGVLPVIVINLIIGFSIAAIDNSAHISGLLAGAALAAVVPFQKPGVETPTFFRMLQTALVALVGVCFFMVAKTYDGPRLSVRNLGHGLTQVLPGGSTTEEFIDAINTAEHTFKSSVSNLEAGRTDRLSSWKAETARSIDKLRHIPSLDRRSDALTADLLRVMQHQYELLEDIGRSGTITLAHSRRLQENIRAYDRIAAEFSDWVRTDGQRFGIAETNNDGSEQRPR
jgi:membrane associated rhomboid family serine protease